MKSHVGCLDVKINQAHIGEFKKCQKKVTGQLAVVYSGINDSISKHLFLDDNDFSLHFVLAISHCFPLDKTEMQHTSSLCFLCRDLI